MNESELEKTLRQFRPTLPSVGLEDRIALALETPAPDPAAVMLAPGAVRPRAGLLPGPRRRPVWMAWLTGLGWTTVGAAAGVAIALSLAPGQAGSSASGRPLTEAAVASALGGSQPLAASASLFEPSESAREVVSSEDAGTLYDEENQPSRLVRYTSIERHTWLNPETGAQVRVEVPREDMVLIPASFQ